MGGCLSETVDRPEEEGRIGGHMTARGTITGSTSYFIIFIIILLSLHSVELVTVALRTNLYNT